MMKNSGANQLEAVSASRLQTKFHSKRGKDAVFSTLLLLPALVISGFILIYPLLKSLNMSLFKINLANPDANQFVWFDNYVRMAHSDNFWAGLGVTTVITIAVVAGAVLIGFILALLLNASFSGRSIMRSLVVIPWAIPPVAAVLSWIWILDSQFGIFNYLIRTARLFHTNINWLSDPNMAVISVTMVQIWKEIPIAAVMLLAGLQTIPLELYEAASIDGASYLQRLAHVTIPGLKTSAGIVVLLISIWTFRQFTIIFLMTEGGPARATETLVIQIYREAFKYFDMGYAAAIGTITFIISLIFGVIYFRCTSEKGGKS
jgi:multiple sugar transport system permease protein